MPPLLDMSLWNFKGDGVFAFLSDTLPTLIQAMNRWSGVSEIMYSPRLSAKSISFQSASFSL